MLKILFMMIFMIPLCFMKNMFWLVQMFLLMMMILFMNLSMSLYNYSNLSYMFGCDMISFGLILLSIWICTLMLF